jgi:hypothetical protein
MKENDVKYKRKKMTREEGERSLHKDREENQRKTARILYEKDRKKEQLEEIARYKDR